MADNRQLYVLCDTNAAVRDAHLFRKRDGILLVGMLRAIQAKLLVPDVLRMEYLNQFIQAGDEALQKAIKELDRLKTFCGYDLSDLLPPSQFGEAQAQEILARLEDIIHVVPTTDQLLIAASKRTMNSARPASKTDHGYKDCLIWESLLDLPAGSEVMLLSRDEVAFFDNGILAPNLVKEAEEKGLLLTAYTTKKPTLAPLLDALTERYPEHAASVAGNLPEANLPLIQATNQLRAAPALSKEPAKEISKLDVDAEELEALLLAQTRSITLIDIKALGFVSYLRGASKQTILEMLVHSDVAPEAASNALQRLALTGLIRDIGHNYLIVDGHEANMAAQFVESEMIKLTELGR